MRQSVDVGPMTSLTESTVEVAALSWLTQLVFGELPVDSRTHERVSGRGSGIFQLLTAGVRTGLVTAAMAATVPMITLAQTSESAIASTPVAAKEAGAGPTGDENDTTMQRAAIPAPVEVELQRRFNELQGELLDDRAAYIDRWLSVVTIALTFFGIVAVLGGYISFRRFREIETEAKNSVKIVTELEEVAKHHLEEIERNREKSDEIVRGLNAEIVAEDPSKAKQAVDNVRENPTASLVDQAIALAVSLQQQGKREEAIEKWRAVAHVAEGIDNDQAAGAWFSVGYLLQIENEGEANGLELEKAIAAYDEAIRLNPNYAKAYNNRGVAKYALGRHDAAVADYDEANRLKPDYAEAYNNRGAAKNALGRHDAAIADCDEAIRLKPDYATAYYNRGLAKNTLGLKDDARKDFETALELARSAGNEELVAKAEEKLGNLSTDGGS